MTKPVTDLKPWFKGLNTKKKGDRSLTSQLKGLEPVFAECKGKSILDAGCAEGLISIELVKAGAAAAHGIEIRPDFVKMGNALRGDLACTFEVADANTFRPKRQYDIVLMLAILHKLRDPYAACQRFAEASRDLVVLRLPPKGAPVIVDERSESKPFDMHKAMLAAGFKQIDAHFNGPYGEWMGFYRRIVNLRDSLPDGTYNVRLYSGGAYLAEKTKDRWRFVDRTGWSEPFEDWITEASPVEV